MRKALILLKTSFLWLLSVFFLIIGLCFLPGISGFLGLVLAAWLMPIPLWQAQFPATLQGKRKMILAIGLFFIMCGAFPNQAVDEDAELVAIPYATDLVTESTTEFTVQQLAETTAATEATTETTVQPTAVVTTIPTTTATAAAPIVVSTEATAITTTEAPTEQTTEAIIVETAAPSTEPPSETVTEAVTEAPTEAPTEAITEAPTETHTEAESTEAAEDVVWVWIPKSGSKYHSKSTCSNMKNPSQASIEDAIAWGYTACSKCY